MAKKALLLGLFSIAAYADAICTYNGVTLTGASTCNNQGLFGLAVGVNNISGNLFTLSTLNEVGLDAVSNPMSYAGQVSTSTMLLFPATADSDVLKVTFAGYLRPNGTIGANIFGINVSETSPIVCDHVFGCNLSWTLPGTASKLGLQLAGSAFIPSGRLSQGDADISVYRFLADGITPDPFTTPEPSQLPIVGIATVILYLAWRNRSDHVKL